MKSRGAILALAVVAIALTPLTSMAGQAQAASQADTTQGYTIVQFAPPSSTIGSSGASVSPLVLNPNCSVRVDWPHISTTVTPKAVKVNATATCTNGSIFNQVTVNVQLWKTGALWDYLQASTSLSNTFVYSFSNQATWKYCANSTQSTFYGITTATATIDGVAGWYAYDRSPNTSLPCGT